MPADQLYFIIFIVLAVLTGVAGLGLFPLLLVLTKTNKKAAQNNAFEPYSVSGAAEDYFERIMFDINDQAVVLQARNSVKNVIISLLTTSGGDIKGEIYNLDFSSGNTVKIPTGNISKYRVLVEVVDGRRIKDKEKARGGIVVPIIYGLVLAVLIATTIFVYALYGSTYLEGAGYHPEYGLNYAFAALGLLAIPLAIVLHVVSEKVLLKGGK